VVVLGQLKDVFVLFFYLVLLAFCLYYSGTMIKLIDYYKALIIDLSALNFWGDSFAVESATLDLSFRGSHVLTNRGLTVWTSDVKVWQPLDENALIRLEEGHQYALASMAHRLLVKEGIGVFNTDPAKDMASSFFAPFEYSPEELWIDSDHKKEREAGDYDYVQAVGMAWQFWLIKSVSDNPRSGILAQIREAVARLSQDPPEWFMPEGLDQLSQPIDIYGECGLDTDGFSKPVREWLDRRVMTLVNRACAS
jgi:hypothetical protein